MADTQKETQADIVISMKSAHSAAVEILMAITAIHAMKTFEQYSGQSEKAFVEMYKSKLVKLQCDAKLGLPSEKERFS